MAASAWTVAAGWLTRATGVMRSAWGRFAVVIAFMTCVSVGVVTFASVFMPTLVYAQRDLIVDDSTGTVMLSGVLLVLLELAVPLTVVVLLLLAGALSTVTVLAADVLLARPRRLFSGVIRGSKRAIPLLGALALATLGLALSVVLAPLLVVAGVVGLLLSPLALAVQTRWPAIAIRPRLRTLLVLAIPLAPTLVLAAWWALVIPATVLERMRPLPALRRSRQLVSGRFLPVAIALVVGLVVYGGSQLAVTGLGGLGVGDEIVLALRVISQTLLVSIPIVISVVVHGDLLEKPAVLSELGVLPTVVVCSVA